MAKRPDLGALIVPKGTEAAQSATVAADGGTKGYAHTLSLRLTADQYRRLRRYVADQEEKTGKRATHQAIIETALDDYLTKSGG
jgi:hypothetical protein